LNLEDPILDKEFTIRRSKDIAFISAVTLSLDFGLPALEYIKSLYDKDFSMIKYGVA